MYYGYLRPKKRKMNQNTPLARKVARVFEHFGHEIPGGPENACIRRTYAGHWQKTNGAWLWELACVDNSFLIYSMGSTDRATDVVKAFSKDPKLAEDMIEVSW